MTAPYSQFHGITPLMISASIVLTIVLTLLCPDDGLVLWTGWAVAGLLSYSIWNVISHFDLKGGTELRAFGISWPLLNAALSFTYCHFPHPEQFYYELVQLVAMMLVISITMSLWQRRSSTAKHLLIGLLIGLLSTLLPHTLLWLLFIPLASYHLRCWSTRNMFSAITGALFGIWVVYCLRFFGIGLESASALLPQYAAIICDEDYGQLLTGLGLWQGLYLGFVLLLLIIYSFTSLLLVSDQAVRVGSFIQLFTSLSLLVTLLLWLDVEHFYSNVNLPVLFIALQLTIHQANLKSALNEWWTLVAILLFNALCIVPFFV